MRSVNEKLDGCNDKFTTVLLTMLNENMDVTITITGDSMLPLWKHKRDSVTLSICNKNTLKKGGVPLYRRETGQYVLHRIIKANDSSYDICGDAQWQIEYGVPKENIIAVVKSFKRKGKEYNCDCMWTELYSKVWILLLPFRGIIFKSYRKMRNVLFYIPNYKVK